MPFVLPSVRRLIHPVRPLTERISPGETPNRYTHMSTNTNTATKVVAKSASEVVKAYATFTDLSAKVDQSFLAVGLSGLTVAKRQGYTERQQVSDMFRLSIYEQEGVAELPDDDAKKVAVADRIKTNVSLWTALVMCKDEAAQGERDKAIAYNNALPKGHKPNLRIGQKLMLDICRGQVSADDTIAIKEGRPVSADSKARTSGQVAKTDDTKPAAKTDETSTDAPTDATAQPAAAALPQPSGDTKPVGNPKDAMRANLRTACTAYEQNLGMTRQDIAAILREMADSLLS